MTIRGLRDGEQDECLDLWAAAFPETGRDYFVKYFHGDALWRPDDTIVCEEGGRLVSAVSIVRRAIGRGPLRLNMAGIANVGTLPEHRGSGYSTACLKRAQAYMEADNFDFSLLGTGIAAYYARLGWVTTPLPAYRAVIPEGVIFDTDGVRPAVAADLPAIHFLYTESNAERPLAVARDESYWRGWLNIHETAVPENLWIAENEDGYIRYALSDDTVFIKESAARDEATERTLLRAVLSLAEHRVAVSLSAALAPANQNLFGDWQYAPANWWMSRFTIPLRLCAKLAEAVGMPTAQAAALLNVLKRETFFAYLFGTERPQEDNLRLLFPLCPAPVWYDSDGF